MEVLGEEHSFLTRLEDEPYYVYKCKWIIQNFNSRMQNDKLFIRSPTYKTSNYEYDIKLYPKGFSGKKDRMSISLRIKTNENAISNRVAIDFNILNDKMEVAHTKRTFHQDNYTDRENTYNHFIDHSDLYDATKNLLVNNQLVIVCAITKVPFQSSNPYFDDQNVIESEEKKFDLSKDLGEAWNNELFADITLVTKDTELHAQKFILAARSPVFAAMLQSDMKEKENSKIVIDDVDDEVLLKMLQFIYTDWVYIGEHSEELLYVANKYDIKGLKIFCEKHNMRLIKVCNFVEMLTLAETYCCEKLKKEVLRFITNHANKIIRDPEFKSWEKDLPPMMVDFIEANAF